MQITIGDKKIYYIFKRLHRTKSLRITINRQSKITVTAPFFVSCRQAENFLIQNSVWVLEKIKHQENLTAKSIFPSSHKDFLLNKSKALRLVRDKITKLNAIYNFKHAKVAIKNMNSRWGSCSKQGNLNFNYKMVYLSNELVEYIVAHELCHLKEMNHRINFWKLVATTIPHWKILRKQLKNIY